MYRQHIVKEKSKGQSIVEWAIILPFLLLIIFSIIELAPLMNTFIKIEKASQYGGRTGAIHGTSNDKILESVRYNMQGMVENDFVESGTTANGGILYTETVNGLERTIVEITPGDPTQRINGSWAMVRVTYRYPLFTPMIKTLFKNTDAMYNDDHFEVTRYAIYRVE